MKNLLKCAAAAVVAVSFVLAGCGGGSPQSLAKQKFDLDMEGGNKGYAYGMNKSGAEYEAWKKKSEALDAKMEKLSDKDKAAALGEYMRLGKEFAQNQGKK